LSSLPCVFELLLKSFLVFSTMQDLKGTKSVFLWWSYSSGGAVLGLFIQGFIPVSFTEAWLVNSMSYGPFHFPDSCSSDPFILQGFYQHLVLRMKSVEWIICQLYKPGESKEMQWDQCLSRWLYLFLVLTFFSNWKSGTIIIECRNYVTHNISTTVVVVYF
jgi:hypothetical protein